MNSFTCLEANPVELPHVKAAARDERQETGGPSDQMSAAELTVFGLVETILKRPGRLDQHLRSESHARELIPRLLAIALGGFTIFGVVATLVLNLIGDLPGWTPAAQWNNRSALNLILAYDLGMIAANGICLPSFYFYGLLSGVRISLLSVAAHAMKGMAVGAVALVGIVPIYLSIILGVIAFELHELTGIAVLVVLALPFIAGLMGVQNLYRGFVALADTMPEYDRERRACFLQRLIFAWSGCYTAVTPLAIYTLWHHLPAVPG